MAHWTLKVVLTWFNDLWKFEFSELVVGSGEPGKCLEEKKIAKVFILSLMSTHDFWNVHIHTQQSKLLQNKQWKEGKYISAKTVKIWPQIQKPQISGNFSFFRW